MRRFVSYGPLDPDEHYYTPREKLIQKTYTQLMGENPDKSGHYITVWAPRQCGKSWVLLQVLFQLRQSKRFDAVKIDLEHLKFDTDANVVAAAIASDILRELGKKNPGIDSLKKFQEMFTRDVLDKPLILILDEFDALAENIINSLASIFRNIFNRRKSEAGKKYEERRYLLHGAALIGVRSVLGIENQKGSPFNVQRGLHIPELTYPEVEGMFKWYEKESGRKIEPEVIKCIFDETRGQPGLTCWFGELLSEGFEGFQPDERRPLTVEDFKKIRSAAVHDLPNSNILNIISKAKQGPYREKVLNLFRTDDKQFFSFDEPLTNFLYMHGVVDREIADSGERYIRFSSPFVQKRLFNYFSRELFTSMGRLTEPFLNLDNVITPTHLNIGELLKLYQDYIAANREWLFKDAPRRSDLRIYEAVFHFNLYMYLEEFLRTKGGRVYPEFPTGNGKIDLMVHYAGRVYGIELKSYVDQPGYRSALGQAAKYGKQLQLEEIHIAFFLESIDDANRKTHEAEYRDETAGITVKPIFIATGQ